jgi:hypothetical protein
MDRFRNFFGLVIDGAIGSKPAAELGAFRSSGSRDDSRAQCPADLDGRLAGTACAAQDEKGLRSSKSTASSEADVCCVKGGQEAGAFSVRHVIGNGQGKVVEGQALICEAAVAGKEVGDRHDALSDFAILDSVSPSNDAAHDFLALGEGKLRGCERIASFAHQDIGQANARGDYLEVKCARKRYRRSRILSQAECICWCSVLDRLPSSHGHLA